MMYLDPGSGSLLIQAIIGGVLAAGYFLRHHIALFVGRFRSQRDD